MDKMSLFRKIINYVPTFILRPKKRIIFESIPDLSDNTKPVFDELIKRNVNRDYELIWFVSHIEEEYPILENVKYITFKNKFKRLYYQITSKVIICCNNMLQSYIKNQKSIYLTHGLPIKEMRTYYTVPEHIDYVISPSISTQKLISEQFNVDIKKVIPLGYPRNDILSKKNVNIKKLFGFTGKIVIWLPTFRQQKTGRFHGGSNAIPIVYDYDSAKKINEIARKNNVLIVIKPHFAQDISYIKKYEFENIKLINDAFLRKRKVSLYQLLSSSDALITDYSSVLYDYTLCNRPIGVVWEDVEEYKKKPGFAVDINYYFKGTEKIYNSNDLVDFIEDVANNKDNLYSERNLIKDVVTFTDGRSSERIADFIISLLQ